MYRAYNLSHARSASDVRLGGLALPSPFSTQAGRPLNRRDKMLLACIRGASKRTEKWAHRRNLSAVVISPRNKSGNINPSFSHASRRSPPDHQCSVVAY